MKNLSAQRAGRRALMGLAGGLTAALALTACGANSDPQGESEDTASASAGGAVVVGSADFPESQIIAEIYAGALNAAGVEATTQLNIGSREIYYTALEDGSIDIMPEYGGNLLLFADPAATAESAEDIAAALPDALTAKSPDVKLGVLEPSEAEDKDALVVTAATAEKYDLTSIADLAEVCGEITIGAPSTFQERAYGLPGLKAKYNCEPGGFEAINDGGGDITLKALLDDTVQAADIYTTTPSIADNDLVVLEDPEDNFIAQQVLPLINTDTVGDEAQTVLNEVSAQLTTEDLLALNREVSGDEKRNPADAAADWLADKGLAG
ncbi:ABC transporter substrate-binding protein [Arthrobacter sp. MDT1-48-3]|jgi:osmoprotectant transport system substrate-binding protein|uniref:Glycine/betaine ABC transporter substrate-binding protein n=1 Tax=Arthrobacter agilis TaxID=37921 RepID=A0A2L0UED2_9MICC|nr:ABC transporter substrate-binding protein [Arthrobacter agilis]AUZ87633.1 glycine/betaine ABC transporter substrate-binding protein [Arthrobacter agilis]